MANEMINAGYSLEYDSYSGRQCNRGVFARDFSIVSFFHFADSSYITVSQPFISKETANNVNQLKETVSEHQNF